MQPSAILKWQSRSRGLLGIFQNYTDMRSAPKELERISAALPAKMLQKRSGIGFYPPGGGGYSLYSNDRDDRRIF